MAIKFLLNLKETTYYFWIYTLLNPLLYQLFSKKYASSDYLILL